MGLGTRVLEYTPSLLKRLNAFFVVLALFADLRGDETHGPTI